MTTASNSFQKIKNTLVFFYVVPILLGCTSVEKHIAPVVEYDSNKAVRVILELDGVPQDLRVYHLKNKDVPILGDFSSKNGQISFTPVLPFSEGLTYGISHNGKQIGRFKIEHITTKKKPQLVAFHPNNDTVPLNILKMYLEFSEPMEHVGNALDHVTVFDETENTQVFPFLRLEGELWNENQTMLTLWFDPGRIKTDLIPNKEKGLPLRQNHNYKITVDKNWKSATGTPLGRSYSKTVHVVGRDTKRPNPANWAIKVPKKKTRNALIINFAETLDPILVMESIKLVRDDMPVLGTLKPSNEENTISFEPSHFWEVGEYHILIHPILEDLAGNNLNNLFDSDLRVSKPDKEIITVLRFSIQ